STICPSLASAHEAGIWDYPSTPEQCTRCAVFRDLREKGYYLGIGMKFSGDYLVYPGDPLRYHSHFVASVITSPRTPLWPMEIVAHGRLGTGTKKSHCGGNFSSLSPCDATSISSTYHQHLPPTTFTHSKWRHADFATASKNHLMVMRLVTTICKKCMCNVALSSQHSVRSDCSLLTLT
ncbi:tRNA intron endonuclease, partial [Pisolithus albus]